MSRYIDAEVLCKENFMCDCLACEDCYKTQKQRIDCEYYSTYSLQDFCGWISETPTADVVEVVRCKDCIYGHQYTNDKVHCSLGNDMYAYRPNDYCSYGERRKDGEIH